MKNYSIFILPVFLASLLAFSCSDENPASVVLVFEEARSPSDYISPSGNFRKTNPTMGLISYIKDDTLRFYSPKTNFDTLSLAVPKEGLEIQIKEKIAPFNYLLQQGDTILVTIDEFGNSFLKSKVSQENTTFYNLPYEISTGQKYLGMSLLVGLVSFGH
ncbi:hypothetical protein C7377_0908 [Balneicella halophila]|uniref:Lipoprotein n=1 Tax=Balneicella halophila TaxID=1537566 RepID=A0A7L4US42_BALHA|nr:hypothetical protein [Balneicella halophila]PVX52580.1 hypothetical protein C7377_0908 [Balneicella halophila]